MLILERKKVIFRHVIFFYFKKDKSANRTALKIQLYIDKVLFQKSEKFSVENDARSKGTSYMKEELSK